MGIALSAGTGLRASECLSGPLAAEEFRMKRSILLILVAVGLPYGAQAGERVDRLRALFGLSKPSGPSAAELDQRMQRLTGQDPDPNNQGPKAPEPGIPDSGGRL